MKGRILGISGINYFRPIISDEAEVIETNYPQVDIQNLPYSEGSFDVVISDQILEHVKNPKKAVEESYRVLKKDGMAIHTTCFINPVHLCPEDYWRFSPASLRYLCKDFSEILQCEGWGNRLAIFFIFLSERIRFITIPERKLSAFHWIASHNDKKYPIVTWVIAKK
jgi:ubiquinone/menaquinone biosynthesis C-methylase UbiE